MSFQLLIQHCATALGERITQDYRLGTVSCKLLIRGVGDTYIVSAPDADYILRVYRHSFRTQEHVNAEVALLNELTKGGVSVARPVPDSKGNQVMEIDAAEGTRYAVLFTYARGRSYSLLNEYQLNSLGLEMARFHNISSAIQLPYERWSYNTKSTLIQTSCFGRVCLRK